MINYKFRENIAIVATFFVSSLLIILPLPNQLLIVWPQWVLLVLIFWSMYVPKKVGGGTAFFVGLYVDLLTGTTLGQHALFFVIIVMLCQHFFRFVKATPFWQHEMGIAFVTILSLIFQMICAKVTHIVFFNWTMLWLIITNMIAWPFIYALCNRFIKGYDYSLKRY